MASGSRLFDARWNLAVVFAATFLYNSILASAQPTTDNPGVIAIVDGHPISKDEAFELFARRYRTETREVIQELIINWLIGEESRREGITIPKSLIKSKVEENMAKTRQKVKEELTRNWQDYLRLRGLTEEHHRQEFQEKLERSWEDYLRLQGLTEEQYRQQEFTKWKYNLALQRLIRLSQYRETKIEARHILVKTREKAREICAKLQQHANFAALAREESLSFKKEGGRLPPIYRGDLPDMEQALFSLKPGEISEVIESQWGFHVVEILEVLPGQPQATWPQLKQQITDSLEKDPIMEEDIQDVQRWLKRMEVQHKIQIMLE